MATVICRCANMGRSGYTNLGHGTDTQWWVHGKCGHPSKGWLMAQGIRLNYFRGGQLDGYVYDVETLITPLHKLPAGFSELLEEYRWTPETVTSQQIGDTARVWQHKLLT